MSTLRYNIQNIVYKAVTGHFLNESHGIDSFQDVDTDEVKNEVYADYDGGTVDSMIADLAEQIIAEVMRAFEDDGKAAWDGADYADLEAKATMALAGTQQTIRAAYDQQANFMFDRDFDRLNHRQRHAVKTVMHGVTYGMPPAALRKSLEGEGSDG